MLSSKEMEWGRIWSYCNQDYRSCPSMVRNDLQQITIKNNHSMNKIKIGFSNQYGSVPIHFSKVVIRNVTLNQSIYKTITVAGNTKISIFPAMKIISDSIDFYAEPGNIIKIETFLDKSTVVSGGIVTYSKGITDVKNFSDSGYKPQESLFRMVNENNKIQFIYGIEEILIPCLPHQRKISFFGDSLVQQGFIVDQLLCKLIDEHKSEIAILNRGIGGSRILSGTDESFDRYNRHGEAGLLRFEKDNFSCGKVDTVIVLHGINDIITAFSNSGKKNFSFENLMMGVNQYLQISKIHGSKFIICTLMPFGNSIFFHPELEKMRQSVNQWIRSNIAIEKYIDLDIFVRNNQDEHVLDRKYDCGDGLHINEVGGKHISKMIELDMLNCN